MKHYIKVKKFVKNEQLAFSPEFKSKRKNSDDKTKKKNRQTPEKKTTDYHKILLTNVTPLHSTERNMYTN